MSRSSQISHQLHFTFKFYQIQTHRCCCFVYFISFWGFLLLVFLCVIYARVLKLSDATKFALEMKPSLVSVGIWSETILGKLN